MRMNGANRDKQEEQSPRNSLLPKDSLLHLKNQNQIDWFGRFRDPQIQEEFLSYCDLQEVPFCFFLFTGSFIAWSFIDILSFISYGSEISWEFLIEELISFLLTISCSMISCSLLSFSKRRELHKTLDISRLWMKILFNIFFSTLLIMKAMKYFLFLPNSCNLSSFPARFSLEMVIFIAPSTLFFLPLLLYQSQLCCVFGNFLLGFAISFSFRSFWNIFPLIVFQILMICFIYHFHIERLNGFIYYRYAGLYFKEKQELDEKMKENMEIRRMIGNVAHDLKTPLASFNNGIDILQDLLKSEENIRSVVNNSNNNDDSINSESVITESKALIESCLQNIKNTNTFMIMTINRVLDFNKVGENKKLTPNYETINLAEVLRFPVECMSNIQERIEIQLNSIDSSICSHVVTDKQWLQENILCLLSNAVKYSSEGPVTVSVQLICDYKQNTTKTQHSPVHSVSQMSQKRTSMPVPGSVPAVQLPNFPFAEKKEYSSQLDGNNTHAVSSVIPELPGDGLVYLVFEVEDHGIGMSEEARATLFSPFQQAQRHAGGTGLGLFSLAKRIEALKGCYGVTSRSDREKGSLFWFSIPYRPDYLTATTNLPETPTSKGTTSGGQTSESNSRKGLKASATNRSLDVLLVDDSASIRKMASMMLKRQGHVITTAENGEIALKKIEEKWKQSHCGFDVILMDLQMPIMDGLEATKRLRGMEKEGRDWMKPSLCNDNHNTNNNSKMSFSQPIHQLVFGSSANYDEFTQEVALEAGFDDFIEKPFSAEKLMSLFNQYSSTSSSSSLPSP